MYIDDLIGKLIEIKNKYGTDIYIVYNNSENSGTKGLLSISYAEYQILKFPDVTLEIVEMK